MKISKRNLKALIENYLILEDVDPNLVLLMVDDLMDYKFCYWGSGNELTKVKEADDWFAFQLIRNNGSFDKLKNKPVYFSIEEVDSIKSKDDLIKKQREFENKYKNVLPVTKPASRSGTGQDEYGSVCKIPTGNSRVSEDNSFTSNSKIVRRVKEKYDDIIPPHVLSGASTEPSPRTSSTSSTSDSSSFGGNSNPRAKQRKKEGKQNFKVKYASPYLGNTLSAFQNWASQNELPDFILELLNNFERMNAKMRYFGQVSGYIDAIGKTQGGMASGYKDMSSKEGFEQYKQDLTQAMNSIPLRYGEGEPGKYSQSAFSEIKNKANIVLNNIYQNGSAKIGPADEWEPSSLVNKFRKTFANLSNLSDPMFLASEKGDLAVIAPMTLNYVDDRFASPYEEDTQHPVDVEIKKIRSFLSRKPGYNEDIDIKVPGTNIILEPSYIVPLISVNDMSTSLTAMDAMTQKKQLSKSDIDRQIREAEGGQDFVMTLIVFSAKENTAENVNESLSRGSLYRRRYWGRY